MPAAVAPSRVLRAAPRSADLGAVERRPSRRRPASRPTQTRRGGARSVDVCQRPPASTAAAAAAAFRAPGASAATRSLPSLTPLAAATAAEAAAAAAAASFAATAAAAAAAAGATT